MEAYQDRLPEIDKARAEYTEQHPIQGGYQIDINGEFTSRAEENIFRTWLKDEGFDIPARLNDTLPA
jgi:hypothetical protein